ncbi:MAG: Zn-dependent exopeptidase M28 [Phycisphaerales bacterium]|nr:MAG: Zn-dependent exopeptidase M28 [Phycisphaerales bacterium]
MKTSKVYRIVSACVGVGLLIAWADPAFASPMGQMAAMHVWQENYRHYLDDMLYAHDGDNRGRFGAEHDLAQANIFSIFAGFGLDVVLEPMDYNGDTYYNVVATKLGTAYPDQEYIIGGHYDSVGNPGAVDNASGVALVLEAARILSEYDSEYTIRFVAFDLEEIGWIGSYAYVDTHTDDNILGMISTDMVAYNPEEPWLVDRVCIWGRTSSSPIMDSVEQAALAYAPDLTPILVGQFDASDHVPFEQAGLQACMFSQCQAGPHYHTQQDSVDTPDYIDYDYATRITRAVVGFLVDSAGVDVTLPDGDYTEDGEVDMADFAVFNSCFSGPDLGPVHPDCLAADFDIDGDIDCDDWDALLDVWTDPDDPLPQIDFCTLIGPGSAPWPHDTRKNRYVSFDPGDHYAGVAFQISLTESAYFPDSTGFLGWLGEPDENNVSPVVSEPFFGDAWPAVLHVGDCRIVPVATYEIRSTLDEVLFTEAVHIGTIVRPDPHYYGDTAGVGTGELPPLMGFTPPNQIVNVNDVTAYLLTAEGDNTPSVHVTWVDLHGLGEGTPPNYVLNVSDLQRILFGLEGQQYADAADQWDPADCP